MKVRVPVAPPVQLREAVLQGVGAVRWHPLRAALAMLAIAVAVATIATVTVALDAVERSARERAARSFGSDTFVLAQVASVGEVSRQELERMLARNPGIDGRDLRFLDRYAQGKVIYAPTAQRRVSVTAGARRFDGAALVGTTAEMATIRDLAVQEGRFFGPGEVTQAAQVPVIGAAIADELFPGQDPVGRQLRLAGRGFRILGLQQRQGNVGGASLDRNVWIPLGAYERAFGAPESLQLLARAATPEKQAIVGAEDHARASMRARRRLQPGVDDNFDILTPDAARDFVLSLSQRVGAAAGPISLMALLSAVVVVSNTILVSVAQRTREIGVRRAVGATRAQIMAEVLAESVAVALVGGAIGLAAVAAAMGLGNGFGLGLELRPGTVAWSLSAAVLAGVVAGWYPALTATRVEVVAALGSE